VGKAPPLLRLLLLYSIEEHPDLWSAMMQMPAIRSHVAAEADTCWSNAFP
jgi:hypothetical protein